MEIFHHILIGGSGLLIAAALEHLSTVKYFNGRLQATLTFYRQRGMHDPDG